MTVKTYNVLLVSDVPEWLCRVSSDNGHSPNMLYPKSEHSAESAALAAVREFVQNDQAVPHGTKVISVSHSLGAWILEVDMEFPDPAPVRTGVPTSSFQTWLDNYGIDSDRVDWASDVAIQLLAALGYKPEDISILGDEITDEPQTLLMQAILHCPALEYVADIMESVNKFGGYIKPQPPAPSVFSLDDCMNYETNERGDCGGRVEIVNGQPICETCRNRSNS